MSILFRAGNPNPDSVISIGNYAFCKCTSLTKITILDNIFSIGDDIFSGCTNLEEIRIADSVLSNEKFMRNINYFLKKNPSCKISPIPKK